MTTSKAIIPLFPLGLAILPGEEMPLHIFEPRYKELISDCKNENISFGILLIEGNSIASVGTNVRLSQITRYYDNGELDVLVKGINVFRVEKYYEQLPQKLYAGAEVSLVLDNEDVINDTVLDQYLDFHSRVHGGLPDVKEGLRIYDIAAQLDLNSSEKMKLMRMESSVQKMKYLYNQMKWKSLIHMQEQQINGNIFPN